MFRSEDYLSVNAWTDVNSYPFPYPVSFFLILDPHIFSFEMQLGQATYREWALH